MIQDIFVAIDPVQYPWSACGVHSEKSMWLAGMSEIAPPRSQAWQIPPEAWQRPMESWRSIRTSTVCITTLVTSYPGFNVEITAVPSAYCTPRGARTRRRNQGCNAYRSASEVPPESPRAERTTIDFSGSYPGMVVIQVLAARLRSHLGSGRLAGAGITARAAVPGFIRVERRGGSGVGGEAPQFLFGFTLHTHAQIVRDRYRYLPGGRGAAKSVLWTTPRRSRNNCPKRWR